MSFHFRSWLRRLRRWLSGRCPVTTIRHKNERRRGGPRFVLEALEPRVTPALATFAPGAFLIDMGQATQTVGNALKPYGLVYDMVTNYKVPVNWAINPDKTTFHLDPGDPTPVDFTATTTTGTKNYSGGSFIIDSAFLTPAVIADVNTWKAQGVVVDTLAATLTTDIYGQVTSFPRAVLDAQNGKLAVPYYANAGVPATSYQIGNPTDLDECDDVYILPHADPQDWPAEWKQALYDFVNSGGGLWAGCHSVAELENLILNGGAQLNFLSNGGLVPFGSHGDGTPPYTYNPAAANDPIMQIMGRLDAATRNGSEQIYVPTTLDWRSTTTVAVFDPDQPNNPPDGTSPFNKAAVIAYGNAFGDPTKGLVMYEAGHSLAGTGSANIAAQRAFFNWLLTEGIIKAPKPAVNIPTITAGQSATITATISGGSGSYSYQWVSSGGGVFSQPAGTWNIGDPPITTQYLLTGAKDTVRLLVTDTCERQGLFSATLVDPPPVIDLDANNSSGATGADYKGYFSGGATVPAADTDTQITDNGTTITSAVVRLTTRPDGSAETLLIDEALAAGFGITVGSDGNGGFVLSGTATLAEYQQVIASLQYTNSLAFPTSTDRVITVTVNDGISDSNTATSRLSFLGGSVTTVNKQLYLSDPGQGMDRVDPVATGDTTTSSVAVTPVVSPNSTGVATWSNSARKNLEYRPWLLTGYGTQGTTATNGGSYVTMASAASPRRNEAIVVGVTGDRHVSGSVWNGSAWTPIAINVGGKVTQNLGAPSQSQWWGAAVAYETNSGRAVLVWNTGSTLNYSVWNGTSWTPAATIPAYTGTEPRQIRIASNPLAGSNEIVVTVTDKNEVDRALVWNGTSWGNQIQLDNNGGHNFTDANVVYEQQSGRAMVVYASGTAGDIGYRIWNGSTWSAANTLAASAGSNNYAQWTVVAADPLSNRIVLGVESNGKDAWMNVWSGSAWGTSTLGVQDGVADNNNLGIAVAFESKSGDALAVYQNDENTNTTELQFKTFSGGVWSAGTNFGSFGNHETRAITLNSNPYSDQVQLLVNDDAKILRSDLWTGTSFAAPIQLEGNTNATTGQPFSYFWDRYAPGTVTTTTTFTQTAPMTAPFVMPQGGAVKVTAYVQLTSGTLPAAPNLAVTLSTADGTLLTFPVTLAGAGSAIVTLPAPPTVTSLGGGIYKLEWIGTIPNNATVPTGGQLAMTLIDYDSAYSFNVLYDSSTFPSQVQVATATAISVTSVGVYGTPYPGGSPLTSTPAGQSAFVRFTVSDPFGASDITGADVVIKNSSGAVVFSRTLTDANVVATTAGSKTYEVAWTPPAGDTFTVTVTAREGTEGVTATGLTTVTATAAPDLVVSKSDGGATVTAGGSVAYTITYSNAGLANATGVLLTEFLPAGATFNAAGSTPGWFAVGTNEFEFAVGNLAPGAGGSVVFAVTVPTPVPAGLEVLSNTVNISDDGTHGADTNPANNFGVDSTPVNAAPDLVITKTDGGTTTSNGDIVLYQITYSNVGTQNAHGVVITETLPANTTFNSTYSFGGWDDEGGGLFTLIVGDLPAGAGGTVTFAVTVNSGPTVDRILNVVSIADGGDSGPDPTPANNTATDTTPFGNGPLTDLQITKTDGRTTVTPGSVVTYTITITNVGPTADTGATFTDDVPASLTGVSYTTAVSGGAAVTPAAGTGNAIRGVLDLPKDATVTYTVTGTLDPNATGTLTNIATILPPVGSLDPNLGNNTAVDSDVIVPVSDLSLAKTFTSTDLDGSGTLTPGDRIVFSLKVTNSGPSPAQNVSVEDLLPNGYQYVSDDAAVNGGTYQIGTGIWTLGSTLGATAPNNTATLHITAIVGPGGTYTNVAQVHSSDSFDPDSTPDNDVPAEDDYASVTPVVQPKSDLSLDKSMALTSDLDGNGILSIGDRVTFTLTLNNLGPNDAANVHVADLLPAGYAFVSATPSQGSYTAATGDWNVGTVPVLATPTLGIVATVVGGKPASAYANYAEVSASGSFDPDSTPGDYSETEDDDATVVPPIADLSVTKTEALAPGGDADGSGTLTVGDQVVFTLTVTNSGPDFATGVKLVDLLPSGFSYDADDSPGTYDPVTGLWDIGVIAPGASVTLNITVTVTATGTLTNTVQVTASQHFDPDSTPNNNVPSEDDQASVTVTPGASGQPPVAVNDSSLHNPAGPVTLNVTTNDTDPNLDLAVNTVDLDPATAGRQTTRTVPGQGTWTVDDLGNVTFTPQAGFTQDPTPITYTVQDAGGRTSNQATITVDYVPVATNDTSTGNTTGTAVTVPVLANDTTGDAPVPSTVQIVGTPTPGSPLVVPGQGTWSVNTATGAITFTPAPGFTGDPTPIQYTVQDNDGNTSNPATVRVDYVQLPPVAVNDSSLNNQPGPVTLSVTGNDTDPNNDLDPGTVDLDPSTPGRQTTLTVPGQGFWQVDTAGNVTFFPNVGFIQDPTPITYTVQDRTGLLSNVATITVTYVPRADLRITKTDNTTTAVPGTTATYTVVVTNAGPAGVTGATVTDTFPANFTGVTWTATATGGATGFTASGGGNINDTVTMPAGSTITYLVTGTISAAAAGSLSNTATVTPPAGVIDPSPGNNSATDTDTLTPRADLAVAKTVSNPTPNVGDTITFTVTLTNTGPSNATGVQVTDLLPTGLTFLSATPSQGTYDSVTGLWAVGAVTASAARTLTLTARVDTPDPRTNTATISRSDQPDPDSGNNTATATETPQQADLQLRKTVDQPRPNVGDTITFAVTLTNAGPDAATSVRVNDLLPAGLTFVDATPGQGTYNSGTGLWTVGTLTSGAVAVLTIRARVDSPSTLSNTASVGGADQFDPNTANNTATATETPQQADLAVGKSVSDPAPNVGDTIAYTITLSNNGPDAATGVTVQDTLPAGVSYLSSSATAGAYDPATRTWTVGTVAAGATQTLTILALVTTASPGANTAAVGGADQFDPNTANNTATASVTPQQADLLVTKAVSDATPNVGDTVTFTVRVTNTGPSAATGVRVNDQLPGGLSFVSATPSQGTYTPAGGLWDVGTLASGATAVLTIQATVVSPAPQTNTASATADQFDPNPGNNTASATESPQQADLRLAKVVSDATPNVGDVVTFTVTLTDLGPDPATNVRVSDLLPAGLTFVSATPSQGTYDSVTGVWDVGTVGTGFARTLLLRARVDAAGTRTNTATVSHSDQFDPVAANNTASATESTQQADLQLTKTVSNARPNVGDVITYTVTLTNTGPDVATGVAVTDLLPVGLGLVSATPSQGVYDSTGGLWTVGQVGVGSPATLVLLARVLTASPTTNVATVSDSDQFDPNPGNNTASATETPQQADLQVTKTVSNARPNVGDTITFTVTLTDLGPDPATGVRISDLLPGGLTFVSATPSQGSYDAAAGTWTVGTVAPGAPQTLQIQARVANATAQTNTAAVSHADQFDPNTTNNSASVTETPQRADLQVSKTVSNPTPNVGDTITFTVTLTDLGPDAATNVTVTDLLPAGLAFVSATPSQGTYDSGTGAWAVGTVTAATPQTLQIQARVTGPGQTTNTATVTAADQFDPNTGNNTAAATETPQQADLLVIKSVDNPTPNVGDTVTYTVTVTNNGPDTATNVVIRDILTTGVSFRSSRLARGSYDPATGVWTVGTLAPGASDVLEITVLITSPNPQLNTATVEHSDQFDPNTDNNTGTAFVDPQEADLALGKTVSDATPNVGDTITFTVTLTNAGPNAATGVQVTDLLPAGLTLVSSAPSQGTYTATSGVWAVGSLAKEAQATLTLTATVVSPLARTNTATITSADQFDPDTGNNTAAATETPQQADLRLTKTVSDATPNVGDVVTFTVTLTDLGPDAATGVTVRDLLPAGLAFISATPSQGTYDSATGVWAVGTVTTTAARTLQIQARVVSPLARTNTATITSADQFDPVAGNNTASATETPRRADLALTKTVSNPTPNVGDTITFTVTLTNAGPDPATGVTVADLLPAGLTFVAATTSVGGYDNISGVWTVGTLADGATGTLTLSARVVSPDTRINTARVTAADQFDPVPGNNVAAATETPQRADLALTKTVSDPTPNVGDTVTFTVTLTNSGPDAATNVSVADLLPAGLTFLSATPSQGAYNAASGVWAVGTVSFAASQTLQIRARVEGPDSRTNTATIAGVDQFDPDTTNNTATAVETPQQADLQLVKTVSNATPNVGDTITYTLTLTNNGPGTATSVTVSEPLPDGLTFVSATASQGSYDGAAGLWTVGVVPPGTPQTLQIRARVVSPVQQTNTASVSHADQFDPDPDNNQSSTTETPQQADLRLTKTVSDATPNVGDVVTFTVTLADLGPDAATGVTVQDLLPAGLAFVSATPSQGTYDSATGVWAVGTVSPGTPQTLQIRATVISPDPRTNTATVGHSDQFDPNTGNNTGTATETPQRADLQLAKTVSDPTPNVGDAITYTVTLSNNGPDPATGVTVTDFLPAGVAFVSATPSAGSYDPGTGVWAVGTVNPGAPQTLTITATVTSPSPGANTASVGGADQFDPNPANNTGTASVDPQQADLSLSKTVSDPTPNVGDTITFTITLTDNGPSSASNVSVTDLLPAGLTLVSSSPSQGTYDPATGLWTVGAVASGGRAVLVLLATVVSPAARTNTATITAADQFDPNTGNNTAAATETPQRADLQLAKTVSNPRPNVGDTVTFTVTLTDLGPDAATGVTVQDLLPAGLTFVSAATSRGTYDSVSGVWAVGSVDPSAAQTLTITARVDSPAARTNTATISHSDQFDPNTGNNSGTATETPQQADLAVAKSVSDTTPNVGDTITFTVTLSNQGPDPATNVSVTDLLPAGLTLVSASPSQGTYNSGTGLWSVGTLAGGTNATLAVQARVDSPAAATNTATVGHSDQFDPVTGNNTGSATETPQQSDLALTKTVSDATPNVGDTITFTVTLTNLGPDPATNVTVVDPLPAGLELVAATPSRGSYDPITGVWTVGTVDPGAPQTLTLQARVVSPAATTNTATVGRSDQFDPQGGNNQAGATESPQQADLRLAKVVSDATPNVGDTITFTVTLTDLGPDAATGVTVQDLLPAGLAFVSAVPSQGTYDSATGVWTVGTVTTTTPQTLQIQARVVSPAAQANTAAISHSDQFDPQGGNNQASATETPQQADLQLTKSVSDPTPNVGDTITYTVTLTNAGPDPASGVTVQDALPPGVTFVSATPSQGTYNAATGVWTVGTVNPGAQQTLTITVTVSDPRASANTAAVSHADQFDPNTGNNTDSTSVVPQQVDLAVLKSVDRPRPNVGDTVTFTVTLSNTGPDIATNVVVSDPLPSGLQFVSATASQGSYNATSGLWTVGTVTTATPQTLQILARVVSPTAQANTAAVFRSDQFDPNSANDSDSATETPQRADLALTKTVSDATPNVGDTVTFTVTLTDLGPDPATGVTVQDLLPAGLTFVSATTSRGTYNSATGVWAVGTVDPSAAQTLTLTARVDSPDPLTNTATIDRADQFDPNTGNNTAGATETPQRADLALSKSVNDPTPNVGDVITFTVTLTNLGPDAATNVSVGDALPGGLTLLSATPSQGTFNGSVWSVGTLTPTAVATLTLTARVDSSAAQTNTAAISRSDQYDPNTGNNTGSATETPQQADLALAKTVSDPTPNVGDTVTFVVTLTNSGPDAATNVAVSDLLPAGLTFVSALPSQGTYNDSTGVWAVGTVAARTPQTLQIQARVVSPATLTNTATISHSDQFDPDAGNNTGSASETPRQADLRLAKTVDNARPNVGDTVTFTVTLTNAGPDTATNVTVQDLLPPGLVLLSATPGQGTYDSVSGVWSVGSVAAGATPTLQLQARIDSPEPRSNVAAVGHSDQFDPVPGNNTGTATVTPPRADLAVAKTVSSTTPNVGDTVTFTVTLTNLGPDPATNVTLLDPLPVELGFVSATVSAGSYDGGTGLWTVGTVSPGAPQTLQIRATVLTRTPQVNTASVSHADQFDPDLGNNAASATETPRSADLAVAKAVSNSGPNVGDVVTFTVTVTDLGLDDATGVTVTDLLPPGLAFVSATPSQGTYDSATGLWAVGTVTVRAPQTLQIRAAVVAPGAATNTATVSHSDQSDPNTANNTAGATTTPRQADLSLAKVVSDPTPDVGDVITFTVTLSNAGPDAATNVTVAEPLPAGLGFVSATASQGGYDAASGLWTVGTVAPGATPTLQIRARVDATGTHANVATVAHADQFDPVAANDTATATVVPLQSDVAITKTVDQPQPVLDAVVTFTCVVTNRGPDPAPGVVLSDPLPPGVVFVSATASQGSYDPATGLWSVGTLPAGATATLLIRVRVATVGPVLNTATVSARATDPDLSNNRSDVTLVAQIPPEDVSKRLFLASTPSGPIGVMPLGAVPLPPPALDSRALIAVGAGAGNVPMVRVFDRLSGQLRFSFYAYDPGFRGGVSVALGDVNRDGVPDVITGTGAGGGPNVRVFDGQTGALVRSFFAYEPTFTGGVVVAVGDVTGDGVPDIVTGTGAGGGPVVAVFDGLSGDAVRRFAAYEQNFRGGVSVAVGDVNRDGVGDIITGTGVGGAPRVVVYDGRGDSQLLSFFAYDAAFRGGVNVAAGDVDGDGVADVVAGSGVGGGPAVGVFSGATGQPLRRYFTMDAGFRGGVWVAAADADGDGRADVVAAAGPGGGPRVSVHGGLTGETGDDFFAFNPDFVGGLSVAAVTK